MSYYFKKLIIKCYIIIDKTIKMNKGGCIINPATGRAVKITSALGKKLYKQAEQLDKEYHAGKVLKAVAKRAITAKPKVEATPKVEAKPKAVKEATPKAVKEVKPKAVKEAKPKAVKEVKPKVDEAKSKSDDKLELVPTSVPDNDKDEKFLDLVYGFGSLYGEGFRNINSAKKYYPEASKMLKVADRYNVDYLPDDEKLNALLLLQYFPKLAKSLITIRLLDNGKELNPRTEKVRKLLMLLCSDIEAIVLRQNNKIGRNIQIFAKHTDENLDVIRRYMSPAQLKLIPKLSNAEPTNTYILPA